jgi:Class II Aldolase and Adducin N-terminal domain
MLESELAEVVRLARAEGFEGEDAWSSLQRWTAEDRKVGPLEVLARPRWSRCRAIAMRAAGPRQPAATSRSAPVMSGWRSRRRGVDKGTLTERDVLLVGFDLQPLEPGVPSAEAPLHAALYLGSPQVAAVLHTHSVAATLAPRGRCRGPAPVGV